MAVLFIILVVILLITLNGLFVAAEIGTVGARRVRIAQEAAAGNRMAQMLLPILESPNQLDNYIAACQLGITLSSLVLGYYGQAVITPLVAPLLRAAFGSQAGGAPIETGIAATGVLIVLTAVQVSLSELAPKTVGIQFPERTALLLILPVRWAMVLLRPLIWFFNGSGRLFLRLIGKSSFSDEMRIHTPEEILLLVQESGKEGLLDEAEKVLLENTLLLRRHSVRHVMVPRTQLLAAPLEMPSASLLRLLAESSHSRLPLYEGSLDNIVGIVHLKDLLCLHATPMASENPLPKETMPGHRSQQFDIRTVMRVPPYVPESAPVEQVFRQLQHEHYHMAVVIDEYGGTAGIVTFEDLIEEIFGKISDEFDTDSQEVALGQDGRLLLEGDMNLERLSILLGISLAYEDVDTLGGAILAVLGAIPAQGQEVQLQELVFRVEKVSGYAVSQVSLALPPDVAEHVQVELR